MFGRMFRERGEREKILVLVVLLVGSMKRRETSPILTREWTPSGEGVLRSPIVFIGDSPGLVVLLVGSMEGREISPILTRE
jgi:hypothetical protein